jgi:8-oxo-dGTP diphosphatase
MSPNEKEIMDLKVVAAVIRNEDGHIMLTTRPEGSHMGGLWEFPGGKIEDGESPAAALSRELQEELGLGIEVGDPITFAVHEEPGLRILLLFYAAVITSGTPQPHQRQEIAWVPRADLGDYPTPPADAALIRMLSGGVDHSRRNL